MRAWARMFDAFLAAPADVGPTRRTPTPTTSRTSTASPAYDGVRATSSPPAASTCPRGPGRRPADAETVCGPRQPQERRRSPPMLDRARRDAYPGSVALPRPLRDAAGAAVAVVSSSRNAAAGARRRRPRATASTSSSTARSPRRVGLPGKPAPDTFLHGRAAARRRRAATRVVVEDALSGVRGRPRRGLRPGRRGRPGSRARRTCSARRCRRGRRRPRRADPACADRDRQSRTDGPDSTAAGSRVDEWRLARDASLTTAPTLGRTETLFAVGNGYLGMRGNVEEGRDGHEHGTFINGFHETWPIRHAEEAFGFARVGQTIVNVPDAKVIRLYVDDEPLVLSDGRARSPTSACSTSATASSPRRSCGARPPASACGSARAGWSRSTERHLAVPSTTR